MLFLMYYNLCAYNMVLHLMMEEIEYILFWFYVASEMINFKTDFKGNSILVKGPRN